MRIVGKALHIGVLFFGGLFILALLLIGSGRLTRYDHRMVVEIMRDIYDEVWRD